MMKVLSKLWVSIKRNPVIVVAILTIGAQAVQKAIDDGNFTVTVIATYFFQFAMAYVARELVVPFKEHKKELREAYMKGVAIPHATPVKGDEID